ARRAVEAFHAAVRERLAARLATEGERRGIPVALAEGLPGETPARLARLDAARFARAAGWWPAGAVPTYAAPPPAPGEARREPASALGARSPLRLCHRVDREHRPPVEDLMGTLEAAGGDAQVMEFALEPWPRRTLRGGGFPS
ncbi:MAG: hypothetical protein ACC662_05870, partial [Planctomycetota bacterium]